MISNYLNQKNLTRLMLVSGLGLIALNWLKGFSIYGYTMFHVARHLWVSSDSVFLAKILACCVAVFPEWCVALLLAPPAALRGFFSLGSLATDFMFLSYMGLIFLAYRKWGRNSSDQSRQNIGPAAAMGHEKIEAGLPLPTVSDHSEKQIDFPQLVGLLGELRREEERLDLPAPGREDFRAGLHHLERSLIAARPNPETITGALDELREILQSVVGTAADKLTSKTDHALESLRQR